MCLLCIRKEKATVGKSTENKLPGAQKLNENNSAVGYRLCK